MINDIFKVELVKVKLDDIDNEKIVDYIDENMERSLTDINVGKSKDAVDVLENEIFKNLNSQITQEINSLFHISGKTEYKVIQEYLKVYGFGGIYSTQPIWINNPLVRTSLPTLEIMQMKIKAEGQFCHNIVILKTTIWRLAIRCFGQFHHSKEKVNIYLSFSER